MIAFLLKWVNIVGEALHEAKALRARMIRQHGYIGE